jgi:hypothetical protein
MLNTIATALLVVNLQVELVGDYNESLPPCFWTRTCGSSAPAPRAYTPPPRKQYYGRSPGAYRPQYEY